MKRFNAILCVLDPGNGSEPALERAVSLAENNQARLTVVDVTERITSGIGLPEGGPLTAQLQAAFVSSRAQELETLVEPYRARIQINTRVLSGIPFLEIIREVLLHGHDLVIKTPEAQGWLKRLLNSDDMHLLRKCPCPVWLVKPQAQKAYRCILAAVDADEAYPPEELKARRALNRQILEMAASLALADFAELHVLHVWTVIGESAMRGHFMSTPEEKIAAYVEQVRLQHAASMDTLIDEMSGQLGGEAMKYLKPQKHMVKGLARKEVPALAKVLEADLIVMGTVGRTGIPGFVMGNTAETILGQIDCSVLAVKPPGFVTPVTLEN